MAREKDAIGQANEELRDKIKKNEAERIQLKRNVDDQGKKIAGRCDGGKELQIVYPFISPEFVLSPELLFYIP